MVTVLLVGALGVAGVGWLKNRIGLLTLAYYLELMNYDPPTEEQIEMCSKLVIRKLLHFFHT